MFVYNEDGITLITKDFKKNEFNLGINVINNNSIWVMIAYGFIVFRISVGVTFFVLQRFGYLTLNAGNKYMNIWNNHKFFLGKFLAFCVSTIVITSIVGYYASSLHNSADNLFRAGITAVANDSAKDLGYKLTGSSKEHYWSREDYSLTDDAIGVCYHGETRKVPASKLENLDEGNTQFFLMMSCEVHNNLYNFTFKRVN
jgi:hypothetical protein